MTKLFGTGLTVALVFLATFLFGIEANTQERAPDPNIDPIMTFGFPGAKAEYCKAEYGIFTDKEIADGEEWLIKRAMAQTGLSRETLAQSMAAGAAWAANWIQKNGFAKSRCQVLHGSFIANVYRQTSKSNVPIIGKLKPYVMVDGHKIDPEIVGKPQAIALKCNELYGIFSDQDLDDSFEWLVALGMKKLRMTRQTMTNYMFAGFTAFMIQLDANPPTEEICQIQHADYMKMVKGAVSL